MPERKGASRDPDAICLGLIVKRLRVQRGWSIRQLGFAIGVHPTHLGVIERGGNLMSMSLFLNLVAVMGIDPGEVLREVLENRASSRSNPTPRRRRWRQTQSKESPPYVFPTT